MDLHEDFLKDGSSGMVTGDYISGGAPDLDPGHFFRREKQHIDGRLLCLALAIMSCYCVAVYPPHLSTMETRSS